MIKASTPKPTGDVSSGDNPTAAGARHVEVSSTLDPTPRSSAFFSYPFALLFFGSHVYSLFSLSPRLVQVD